MPPRPQFHRRDVMIGGETFSMYSRDIVECIKALYGDARFAHCMKYRPERHFKEGQPRERIYHDMYTGDWWWELQVSKTVYIFA